MSKIYNLYWYFAAERQNIFYKKLNGEEADLIILNSTGDKIENILQDLKLFVRKTKIA